MRSSLLSGPIYIWGKVVGDINLSAAGNSAYASASIVADTAATTNSAMTLGDLDLSTSIGAADTALAYAYMYVDNESDLTVGDITIGGSAAALTGAFSTTIAQRITVSLDAAGDLTVGDITVSGSGAVIGATATAADVFADNFGDLGWLSLTATGDITVGDIDYSGYAGSTSLDVSGYLGAAAISAAQGGGDIALNTTKNVVTLAAGADTVIFDSATVLKDTADVIDTLIGFASGADSLEIDLASALDFAFSSVGTTYDAFLTTAGNAMAIDDRNIFAQTDGSDTWVAIDTDDSGDVDFVIELSGVTSVTAGDFAIV